MNTHPEIARRTAWLYDGKPEHVDLNVVATSSLEGGYVIALQLAGGALKLAATRHPAKYVSAWRYNVRRYGLPDVVRVLISPPSLRYQAVKRGLVHHLEGQHDLASDAYRVAVETLTEKTREMFAATRA
jgi:hypothetical protein